ncbi:2301_t:CDS:2, partial [Acaulospora colombiana]
RVYLHALGSSPVPFSEGALALEAVTFEPAIQLAFPFGFSVTLASNNASFQHLCSSISPWSTPVEAHILALSPAPRPVPAIVNGRADESVD